MNIYKKNMNSCKFHSRRDEKIGPTKIFNNFLKYRYHKYKPTNFHNRSIPESDSVAPYVALGEIPASGGSRRPSPIKLNNL